MILDSSEHLLLHLHHLAEVLKGKVRVMLGHLLRPMPRHALHQGIGYTGGAEKRVQEVTVRVEGDPAFLAFLGGDADALKRSVEAVKDDPWRKRGVAALAVTRSAGSW